MPEGESPCAKWLKESLLTCCQILIAKSLKRPPFTDTELREMAINFPEGKRSSVPMKIVDDNKN